MVPVQRRSLRESNVKSLKDASSDEEDDEEDGECFFVKSLP